MIGYAEYFENNNKAMSLIKKLLKKYTKIWGKISSLMNKEFDCKPVYGDNYMYIKTKTKPYGEKINRNFRDKKHTKRKYIIQMFVIDNARFCY